MSNCKIENLKGAVIGWPNAGGDQILNGNGQVLFSLRGNQLISTRDGEVYTILDDGRIFNRNNVQTGFFCNYASLVRPATGVVYSTPPRVSYPVYGPQQARNAYTANMTKVRSGSKKVHPAIIAVIAVVIISILAVLIIPSFSGIEGTWVIDKVTENGEVIPKAEVEEVVGAFEMNIRKDGTLTFSSLDYNGSLRGSWYKSSGNTYVLTINSLEMSLYGSPNTITMKMKHGKLVFEEDGVTLTLKKK